MFKLCKTYEVWTPRDVEFGESSDHGFEYEENEFETLEELAREIRSEGCVEASCSIVDADTWFATVDGEIDYETGAVTNYGFHPEGLTADQMKQLAALLK